MRALANTAVVLRKWSIVASAFSVAVGRFSPTSRAPGRHYSNYEKGRLPGPLRRRDEAAPRRVVG